MNTILNIALLIVGAASTVAAFGGKTWIEGQEPLIKRITSRGWISVICLVLALAIGIMRELHTRSMNKQISLENKLEATEAKAQADKRQSETQNELTMTQGQLAAANAKLGALEKLVQLTEDQITGGNGFPLAIILWDFPDKDGSFPLQVTVQGNAPLNDMNYSVTEGLYKRPSLQEVQQMTQQSIAIIYGHSSSPEKYFGLLNPHVLVPLGHVIRPQTTGVSTYRIGFRTRNRSVQETLDVRFNAELKIWQYRYVIKSEDTRDPNKILARQDWEPKKNLPILYGEGPP
jgi:hypothetical protein